METERLRKVTVDYVNATEGYHYRGFSEEIDKTPGEIFKIARSEYGKCVSKMFIDVAMGDGTYATKNCGWVFQKRVKYSDCKDVYLQETWVTVC
jgi:hypothetical protein